MALFNAQKPICGGPLFAEARGTCPVCPAVNPALAELIYIFVKGLNFYVVLFASRGTPPGFQPGLARRPSPARPGSSRSGRARQGFWRVSVSLWQVGCAAAANQCKTTSNTMSWPPQDWCRMRQLQHFKRLECGLCPSGRLRRQRHDQQSRA